MGSRFFPNRQQESDKRLMFTVGKMVEVSFDTEAFKHICFPAKILEQRGSGFFLVEWQKRDSRGDPCSVKETLDSLHIRPCPPTLKATDFSLLDKVDAIFDFGWRSGVITKVLADNRYMVFFKHAEHQREFRFSELRPHMEWRDGNWFNTSQDAFSIPPGYENIENANAIEMATRLGSSVSTKNSPIDEIPSSLILRKDQIDLEIPLIVETLDIDPSLRERVSDPSLDHDGKEELQWDIQSGDSSLTTGAGVTESTCEGKLGTVAGLAHGIAENGLPCQSSRANLLSVNLSQAKILKRKQIESGEQEERSGACSRKTCEGSVDIQVKKTRSSGGLACGDIRNSGSIHLSRSNNEEPKKHIGESTSFHEDELHIVTVSNQLEVEYRSLKNLHGRLTNPISQGSTTFSEKVHNPLIDVEIATLDVSNHGQVFGINGGCKNKQIKKKNELGSEAMSWLGVEKGDLVEGSIMQCKSHTSKKSGMLNINLNLISEAECDVVSPNTQKGKATEANCAAENLEMDSELSPNNPFDVQLLTNSVGDESATTIGSSMSSETRNENAPALDDERGINGSEYDCLPFIKASPLWSTIESMEIFQKRPQNPHFRSLQHSKESCREGLAVGCMVTFASVVEKTSKMQFDDPQVYSMDDILETLSELEKHGFNVQFVRDRISYLGHMREKQEKLEEEMVKVKNEMIMRNIEKSKMEEELEEMNDHIKEMEEKLVEAFLRKEMKDVEICKLQSKMKGFNESITSIQCGFDGSLF